MRFLGLIVFTFLWMLMPVFSYAQEKETGDAFLGNCGKALKAADESATYDDAFDVGLCYGFIFGARDVISIWRESGSELNTCIPSKATNGQLIRVFVKFLEDHPERLHERATDLFVVAAEEAFPCKE